MTQGVAPEEQGPRQPGAVRSVAIVGAGLGGLRTAQHLRTAGFRGRISLVGSELHPPYDRPPLSKQLLAGTWTPERLALVDAQTLRDLELDLHLGRRVERYSPEGVLHLSDGSTVSADVAVLAVGVEARRLPDQPAEVLTLRTLDDAVSLRQALLRASSLLVVGAGFVGAEVASTAVELGVATTVIEAQPVPLSRVLGPQVGALCARLMAEAGVDLRTGTGLAAFRRSDDRLGVELTGGQVLWADVIVVGIGGRPDVGWLSDTGIDLSDGVPCDQTGRVSGLPATWALGDAAAWSDHDGVRSRHEHWTSATEQAAVVAADVLDLPRPPRSVPYFWSDQFGLKIQLIGHPERATDIVSLHGEALAGGVIRGSVVGYSAEGRLVALVGFSAGRLVSRYRAMMSRTTSSGAPDLAEVRALQKSFPAR